MRMILIINRIKNYVKKDLVLGLHLLGHCDEAISNFTAIKSAIAASQRTLPSMNPDSEVGWIKARSAGSTTPVVTSSALDAPGGSAASGSI